MANSFPLTHQTAPSRPSHLRQANARGLLQLLRAHNPCSKADLVRLSGLSAPTVSTGVSHLESLGLVDSIGEGESSGGRPPELLRFNANHGYVAAADIGGTRLRMMMTDLNGVVATQWSTVLQKQQKSPESMCDLIHTGLKVMCRQCALPKQKVLHLSAGAPGITNVTTGVVVSAPNLKDWNDVPLRDMLQRELGIPVVVENDTNLAAVGEHRSGAARDAENFVFVAMGTGVGAGVFLRGQLHHGAQWTAGEIGYFRAGDTTREPLQVRQTGQLERIIGGDSIEALWTARLGRSKKPAMQSLAKLHAFQIFDLARDGDPIAREVLSYTAGLLAEVITDISLLLNPEVVVLGGGVGSHPELCRATQALIDRHEFARPQLRSSSLGTQAQLFGAIALSLAAVETTLLQ
jgi:glucokinase